jgi:sigma-B regulation protein RsbU (phosphoserine phosphatase)
VISEATTAELTAELVNSQDQQLALYELSQAMRQKRSIEDAVKELGHLVARTMKVQAVGVIVAVPDRSPIVSHYQENATITEKALQEWLRKIQASHYYILQNQVPGYESLLVLPLQLNEDIVGVLAVANKISGPMASPDRKLGQAIVNQAGIYFENLLFAEQRVAEAKVQTELKLARDVQMQLLPQRPPDVSGLDITGFSEPALQVGGDTYDFLVDGNQHFHICVGDVSGKGMSAALLMTMVRTTLRNAWQFGEHVSPATAIERTNASLYDDFTETGMFATLFVASYDAAERTLRYANAGHSPVIYRPHDDQAQLLEADGVPVGVLNNTLVEDRSMHFGEGDLLVVCTDGLNDAHNQDGELSGGARLMELVNDLGDEPAEKIAQILLTAVAKFTAGQPQADDQTLVILRGQV